MYAFRTPFPGEKDKCIKPPLRAGKKALIYKGLTAPKCVERWWRLRCCSASLRRRTLAAQSGQYFPRLDLGTNAAPQTAQRFWLPRYKRAADSSPSRGRTATRNQRHMREREMLWTHTQGVPDAAPAGAGGSPCGAGYRSWLCSFLRWGSSRRKIWSIFRLTVCNSAYRCFCSW